jgi:hypothetical protein
MNISPANRKKKKREFGRKKIRGQKCWKDKLI